MNVIEREIQKVRRRKKLKLVFLGLFFLVIGIFAILGFLSLADPLSLSDVSVVRVEGLMVTGPGKSASHIGSEYVGAEIRKAADDPLTRAIVLRIDSPGGTPAAAQEIIRDITYAKEKKPVVVSMGDAAPSAAYYIAAYADRIYSSPDTMTGGIGVMWVFYDLSRQFDLEGIEVDVVKSGDMKDMTHPYRTISPDEEAVAQELVDASFDRLFDDISSQRNITRESIEDGRLIRGEDAIALGLVDEIGNLQDAIAGARAMARAR
ncbi:MULTISPECIES: signal peptide peptidase SppA [Methanocalculus]|uniref:signal peptide peptidase SppA n=2 Tax=Methanocalculaceae TaxID=1460864 RepID=UPI00209D080F|nr:signal peptide peptidase SppA [Methanocalculus sp. AMF5]MCP1662527.1 protease-4 [Methanocalculus sp. AMF5]